MTYFIYLIYYQFGRFERWTNYLIAIPLIWIFRRPMISAFYKKRSVTNGADALARMLDDPRSNVPSRSFLLFLILFYLGAAGFLIGLVWKEMGSEWFIVASVVICVAALITDYFMIDWNTYLSYLRKFKRKAAGWQRKTALLTLLTVLGVGCFVIGGVVFYGYRHALSVGG